MGETKCKLSMDSPDKILLKRGLNKNGRGQLFFSNEFARLCERYVPIDSSALQKSVWIEPDNVSWNTPYARRQFFEHKKKRLWAGKCWQDHKKDIIRSTARYCGLNVK